MNMPSAIVNIAAYKFVFLTDVAQWRVLVLERAQALSLKGTVLVSHEGINLCLAGTALSVDAFIGWLCEFEVFADLQVKTSLSETIPFKRLKVKVKNEIIRMNHPAIHPAEGRAPAVDAQTAKHWISQGHDDAGRPLVLLDTRNDFEVQKGTFKGALNWHLQRFTQFPEAVNEHRQDIEGKTVISFCTGGIRCEKAAIYMQEMGLKHVYQLNGGILKYFEETGGEHYEGDCFVFDERTALDPTLHPSS
jgi:UPF0176 protein